MTKRPKFGPELKQRFVGRGYTMARAAKELGLYENSLRSWIRRNRFPERELVQLAIFAGMGKNLAEVTEAYHVEVSRVRRTPTHQLAQLQDKPALSLDEVADTIEDRVRETIKGKDSSLAELQLLLRSLDDNACYVCAFLDRIPEEFMASRYPALTTECSSAMERGARFIYLFPSHTLAANLKENGLTRAIDEATVRSQIGGFRDRIMTSSTSLSIERLQSQIVAVATDSALFLAPGHVYRFFRSGGQLERAQKLYLKVTLKAGLMNASPLQPLADDIADEFLAYILEILANASHKDLADSLIS